MIDDSPKFAFLSFCNFFAGLPAMITENYCSALAKCIQTMSSRKDAEERCAIVRAPQHTPQIRFRLAVITYLLYN